jgi:hypothetical protein
MEIFSNHCHDFRPNITYLAIGAAYSESGGMQQYPPFLKKLISEHSQFNYQIILIDPLMENPPKIVEYLPVKKYDVNWYGNDNINLHVIRQYFSYNSIFDPNNNDPVSKNFLFGLIERTMTSKYENPTNTYLLFVHDFSGYRVDKLADFIWDCYQKTNETLKYIYQKNVLIDLNNKIDSSCFPDMENLLFHPQLILDTIGTYEIFNPFFLGDDEIYTLSVQNYKNPGIKILLTHALIYRLNNFVRDIIPLYRQIRMALEDTMPYFPTLICNDLTKILVKDLDTKNFQNNIFVVHSTINKITSNMFEYLKLLTGYLDLFKCRNMRKEIFGDFEDFCMVIPFINHYDTLTIFRQCQKKLEIFLAETNPAEFFGELSDYTVQYVMKHGKLPLFLKLLLQDDNKECVNDISVVMEF